MMGLAIAHQIREQVVFPKDVIEVNPFSQFSIEKEHETAYDYGENITIV
jgi:hypothetical protein